jgi:hypothetical protein
MAQRIFAQLDQLQRGARETPPRRQEYGQHHMTHAGYDEYDQYDQAPAHYDEEDLYGDENMIPPDFNGTRVFKSLDPSITDWPNEIDAITAPYGDQLDARPYRSQVPQTQETPVARRFDLCE